ncbi:MAG: phosphoribosylglycinamide formyltransferase [Bacteroidales bacterium]|nr:phosphoribosylglycinamide formyltransferase [Bacteroidales bacterium]
MNIKKKIAIFASGSGTNFEALAQACADGRLNADVVLMVCDKPGAKVIERAERFGVESFVFSPKSYASKADFETEIVQMLRDRQVDLICLAGYMRLVGDTLLAAYRGKIINIHPSLLPAFKGAHAVEDAVAYGVKVYGITIHYVDETLDGGKIIAQRAFPYDGNDPDEVHRIGQKIEHELYVETVGKLLGCEYVRI